MSLIDTMQLISKTADELIDFLLNDKELSGEFEEYLKENNIQIQRESEFSDILISYILDGYLKDGTRILDYISNHSDIDKKLINSLKESFISVFEINKISKNCFDVQCVISQNFYTLYPLVKTTNLRGIGLSDYIKARVFEIDNLFYLLEIFDCTSKYNEYEACLEAVNCAEINPSIALKNKEKEFKIKNSIKSFHSSFVEIFETDEVITTTEYIDDLIEQFYNCHTGYTNSVDKSLIKCDIKDLKFFKINSSGTLYDKVLGNFKGLDVPFDIGFYSDINSGLFLIPFLKTFETVVESGNLEIEGSKECVLYYLNSPKIPKNLLLKKYKEYPNMLDLINKITGKNFETIEICLDFYKNTDIISSLSVLYNLPLFSKILNKTEEESYKAGRNDPCPCGSGKKFKKCCMNKELKI